ncbi:MAG: LssY C-terminal domain-containing protein [Planctomycetota bacterium]
MIRKLHNPADSQARQRLHWNALRTSRVALFRGLTLYLLVAYLVLPLVWRGYEHCHPALNNSPTFTSTGNGHPGDPLNIALIGDKADVIQALLQSKWHPADPLSLKSSIEIAGASVLRRPYVDAPVSSLFLRGRKQDLAFEQPVGNDPSRRHHVRFWLSPERDRSGQQLWIGAVTYDKAIGLSHTTGQITHHIDSHVDRERDKLLNDLQTSGSVRDVYWQNHFQPHPTGRNGGGDLWETDQRLAVIVLQ